MAPVLTSARLLYIIDFAVYLRASGTSPGVAPGPLLGRSTLTLSAPPENGNLPCFPLLKTKDFFRSSVFVVRTDIFLSPTVDLVSVNASGTLYQLIRDDSVGCTHANFGMQIFWVFPLLPHSYPTSKSWRDLWANLAPRTSEGKWPFMAP